MPRHEVKSLARLLGLIAISLWSTGVSNAASLMVTWEASADSAVAGYIVYWGAQSGNHTQSLDVGKVNAATITIPVNEQMLFFVVRAYDASRQLSPASKEAAASLGTIWRTPALLQMGDFDGDGARRPDRVSRVDGRVARELDDRGPDDDEVGRTGGWRRAGRGRLRR